MGLGRMSVRKDKIIDKMTLVFAIYFWICLVLDSVKMSFNNMSLCTQLDIENKIFLTKLKRKRIIFYKIRVHSGWMGHHSTHFSFG